MSDAQGNSRQMNRVVPIVSEDNTSIKKSANKSLLDLPQSNQDSETSQKLPVRSARRPGSAMSGSSSQREVNHDAISESSLNEADKLKLEKILRTILNNETAEDREQLEDLTVEWVDPTPNLVEGIFHVNQTNIFLRCCSKKRSKKKDKIVVYDQRSLYCLHFKNPLRIEIVNFAASDMFENFIILLILLNTIVLAIYDYDDRDNETQYN